MKDVDERILELERMLDKKITDLTSILSKISEAQKNNSKMIEVVNADIKHLNSIIVEYKVLSVKMKNLEEKINDLEESRTWMFRMIVGIVIGAVIELAFRIKYLNGGN